MSKLRLSAVLSCALFALPLAASPAFAAETAAADPTSEYSGSVLGGDQLTFPPQERFLDFAKLTSKSNFALGVDVNGYAWGWGGNGLGNLGNTDHIGRYQFISHPAPMYDINGDHLRVNDLSAGYEFSLALDENNFAWTYGSNNFGQLGNPEGFQIDGGIHVTPLPVLDTAGNQMQFDRVVAGTYTGYGMTEDGRTWGWGRNGSGELANSGLPALVFSSYHTAVPINGADGNPMLIDKLATGEEFTIAVDKAGLAWGWGRGGVGQLGPQTTAATVVVPVPLTDATGTQLRLTDVAAGRGYAVGIDTAGNAWSWGENASGNLGNPSIPLGTNVIGSAIPIPIVDGAGTQQQFAQIYAGIASGYGIKADGTVWSWGRNTEGQLGDPAVPVAPGAHRPYAAPVLNADGSALTATSLSVGLSFANAIAPVTAEGRTPALAWGENQRGQLGTQAVPSGSVGDRSLVPVQVRLPQPTGETRLYLGEDDTVGITGTVSADGKTVTFTMPPHEAGLVPLFLSWAGDGVLREDVGFYTYMLDPSITVAPASVKPGESETVTITVPAAEVPYIGDAVLDVTLAEGLEQVTSTRAAGSIITGDFDATGKLEIPVTSDAVGSYVIGAQAVVREAGEADVLVSKALSVPAVFAAEVIDPPKTVTPPPGDVAPPVNEGGLPITGATLPIAAAILLLGTAAAVFTASRLRRRA